MELYEAIHGRRDVRAFRADPVPEAVLARILEAAHRAPSVGLMEPWDFVLVRARAQKERVRAVFEEANERAATAYDGDRQKLYKALKLEGILEAPLNIAVTCDHARKGPNVLGRQTIRETDVYSTCCAVQNLWLAARAEGVGVGWVSILDPDAVKRILEIPPRISLIAYLCVGYPVRFADRPELEQVGWEQRAAWRRHVHEEALSEPESGEVGA
jgi:5,6-dimethylbenzimidazole synthase